MNDEFDRMMEMNYDVEEGFKKVRREHLDEVLADIDSEKVLHIENDYLPNGGISLNARQAFVMAMVITEPFNMAVAVNHITDVVDAVTAATGKKIGFTASLLDVMSEQVARTFAWSPEMDGFLIKQRALVAAYELGFVEREELEQMLQVGNRVLLGEMDEAMGDRKPMIQALDEELGDLTPFEVLDKMLDGDTDDLPFDDDDDIVGDTFKMCEDLGIPYDEAKARGGDKAYVAELIVQCFATMNDISTEDVRKAFGEER